MDLNYQCFNNNIFKKSQKKKEKIINKTYETKTNIEESDVFIFATRTLQDS